VGALVTDPDAGQLYLHSMTFDTSSIAPGCKADRQLAYLKANGYRSVTLAQYQEWLAGRDIGIAKPVVLTVDDGLNTEVA
jgi:hypothetical protein